ncbi:unnamed protein product, partial [Ranitomeya imitator]
PLHIKRRCSDTDNNPDRCSVAVWSLESCHTDRSPATNDAGNQGKHRAALCFSALLLYWLGAGKQSGDVTALLSGSQPVQEECRAQRWRTDSVRFPVLGGRIPSLRGAVMGSEKYRYRNDAVVISGRKLARQIRQEARQEVEQWVATGNKRPHLSVVLVGDNPASHSYVLNKTRAAADVGISSETILKSSSISQDELLDLINKLNSDRNVDGLLVQLPLPEHIDEREVCNAVIPDKDVDGFHVVNVGRMCLDQDSMLPATPWGVWEIIKRTGIPTLGKNVVVAGRSKNVGMPIAMLLHTDGRHERPGGDATVTISHRYTPKEQLKMHTRIADIVVAAAGIPNLITADMIKEGAAVIDVGINRVQDPITGKAKLVGDVDFEEVRKKASYITPVPGGVGPMTVAMLMKNTIIAAKKLLKPTEQLPAVRAVAV